MKSLALLIPIVVALSGCADEPLQPPPSTAYVPDTNVYFYPADGLKRSAEQQDLDKYQCNQWAVKRTGFDPGIPHLAPHQQIRVVASDPPPDVVVGAGAATGAIVGAAVARPWETGRGALIGAAAGALLGGVVESERENENQRAQEQLQLSQEQAQHAALEQQAAQFRRAIGACLEARGYVVK